MTNSVTTRAFNAIDEFRLARWYQLVGGVGKVGCSNWVEYTSDPTKMDTDGGSPTAYARTPVGAGSLLSMARSIPEPGRTVFGHRGAQTGCAEFVTTPVNPDRVGHCRAADPMQALTRPPHWQHSPLDELPRTDASAGSGTR
jgi:hypothetical protein